MMIVGINTRVVEELLSSLIAKVINIGTQIAIVRASSTSNIAQVPELNIWSKTPAILAIVKSGTATEGNPTNAIRALIALTSMNGENAHNIILNLWEASN